MNFDEYYRTLTRWEGNEIDGLITPWDPQVREEICRDVEAAFRACGITTFWLNVRGATNQSIGNRVATLVTERLNGHLQNYRIAACPGAGYPDKLLIRNVDRHPFAFEMKATSYFDENDGNRIVLTSSSRKLRAQQNAPTNHLLATACYTAEDREGVAHVCVTHVRLDFLEPNSPVDVRLEASVTKKSLSRGEHHSQVIRPVAEC